MHPRPRAQSLWKGAVAATVAAATLAACSAQQCKDMKSSGSAFGGLFCGGEGDTAPEPAAPAPNACSDVRAVMPEFFVLLERSDQPLGGLRRAVQDLGAFTCPGEDRACRSDDDCQAGSCTAGLCPCQHPYSPLAEILALTFRGLATVARQGAEPGAPAGSLCVTPTQAALLQPAQLNQLCELRRTLDVVLLQQGGQNLLNDPQIRAVTLALLHYVEGRGPDGRTHYDLFTTLGRMANNPDICDPLTAYALLDKGLLYLQPAAAQKLVGDLQALLADPVTVNLLHTLGGSGGSADQRLGFQLLVKGLSPGIIGAPDAATALGPLNQLLVQFVYNDTSGNFPDTFKAEVKAVFGDPSLPASAPAQARLGDLGLMLAPATGIFAPTQQLLKCAVSRTPYVDPDAELVGALYDLLSAQQSSGAGIDLGTLLGAVKTLITLDTTGQLVRTLRGVINDIAADADATESLRQLLALGLTADEAQKLLPALDALVQYNVLPEFLSLLEDVLYSCKPPSH